MLKLVILWATILYFCLFDFTNIVCADTAYVYSVDLQEGFIAPPSVTGDGNFIGITSRGNVASYNSDGSLLWLATADAYSLFQGALINDTAYVYVELSRTSMQAISINGQKQWSIHLNGEVLSAPIYNGFDKFAVLLDTDKGIYISCWDADGNEQWRRHIPVLYSYHPAVSSKYIWLLCADNAIRRCNWVNGDVMERPASFIHGNYGDDAFNNNNKIGDCVADIIISYLLPNDVQNLNQFHLMAHVLEANGISMETVECKALFINEDGHMVFVSGDQGTDTINYIEVEREAVISSLGENQWAVVDNNGMAMIITQKENDSVHMAVDFIRLGKGEIFISPMVVVGYDRYAIISALPSWRGRIYFWGKGD